ncbi:30S ribosomal protein S3 [Candidatus Uhrbacteria bacterium]|nr:30S ribosomal protein S3 [Candidatus Uhrbacteria bacterium]
MGQKVNPKAHRIGVIQQWSSRWFASHKDYSALLKDDLAIRKLIRKTLFEAGVARVDIERGGKGVTIVVHAAKPGVAIGRGGQGVEDIKKQIQRQFFPKKKGVTLTLQIQEVSRPSLSAELVLQAMVADLQGRIPFRRVMKQSLSRIEKSGALGARVALSGRLDGAEIARREHLAWGKLPLQSLRADIDYSRGAARTIYGTIGIKVWVYRGEVFEKEQ